MKLPMCFANVITTWSAWFFFNASAEALKEGQKLSLATKLLQSTVPLVLLWGGDMPPSLSNHTCWKSTKIRPAPGASFYHEVETGWLGDCMGS
ncbi:hypothetical protein V5799_029485 [Amblyomma americanum]|uniref:Secreted protein n=1 Tax=Amblyomma americanum TaxID=6943 RepID=A0AAQ4ER88_AMBAM